MNAILTPRRSVGMPFPIDAAARQRSRRVLAGRGVLLGAAWTSEDEAALNTIFDSTFPKVFGPNWPLQLLPLTRAQVREIVKAAMYYYGLGYALTDWKRDAAAGGFRNSIQKSLPKYKPLEITKVLSFISRINKEEFPGDYALLSRGHAVKDASKQQQEQQAAERRAEIAYEIQDKIKRGTGAIASTAVEVGSLVNAALPWYFRPTTLLAVAAVGGLGYLLLQKKAAGVVRKAISYRQNPVELDPGEKQQAARRKYKEFHGRNPKKTISLPGIDTEHLTHLGYVKELGYSSDKWTGKKENYLHDFGRGVRLMCTPDGKTLVITGGKMRVEDVGIVN